MNKLLLLLIFIVVCIKSFSQSQTSCQIVTNANDTITGVLKGKTKHFSNRFKLFVENEKIPLWKKEISQINVDGETYVRANNFWFSHFYKKELDGNVNLYSFKNSYLLGASDSDINFGRLKPALKFYCDDFPNFSDRVKIIDENNIHSFIKEYNDWKSENHQSFSTFEREVHYIERFNIKASYFLPGVGFEVGLGRKSSINLMLKTIAGYNRNKGVFLTPYFDGQFRVYHDTDKRIEDGKRTYNRTGKYLALTTIIQNDRGILGFEYGWQLTSGKKRYDNLGLGIGVSPSFGFLQTSWNLFLLFDYDIGYIL